MGTRTRRVQGKETFQTVQIWILSNVAGVTSHCYHQISAATECTRIMFEP